MRFARLRGVRCALLLPAAMALLSGCAGNPFERNYEAVRAAAPALAPDEPVRVIRSADPHADAQRLMEQGHMLLGLSRFNASGVSDGDAVAQARAVGARVVVVSARFTHTDRGVTPYTDFPPSEEYRVRYDERVRTGDGTVNRVRGTRTVRVQPYPETVYVPYEVDYYDTTATFWRERRWACGIVAAPLDDAARQRLGRNTGAQVVAVVEGSPAFLAGVLKGDAIVRAGGVEIEGPEALDAATEGSDAPSVLLEIDRAGRSIQIDVPLRTAAMER